MAVIPAGIGLNWYEQNRKMHSEIWQFGELHAYTGPQMILYDAHEDVDVGLLPFTYHLPFMENKCLGNKLEKVCPFILLVNYNSAINFRLCVCVCVRACMCVCVHVCIQTV